MKTTLSTIVCLIVCCGAALAGTPGWLGPSQVLATKDGSRLVVAHADANQLALVDPAAGKVVGTLAVPAEPTGMAWDPSGRLLYVTCAAPRSTVCVVDVSAWKIVRSIAAGYGATGPSVSPDGKQLYVCNRFDNRVAVFDAASGKETASIPTVREPYGSALTPDGQTLFVIDQLPADRADGNDVAAAVTVVDTATNKAQVIRLINGSSSVKGICVTPDGKYACIAHVLSRYQMPTTQLERGWVNTNALTILDAREKKLLNAILLDDVDLGAANPWGVVCSPDGKSLCVTHYGTHELSVVSLPGVLEKLAKLTAQEKATRGAVAKPENTGYYTAAAFSEVPNDLAFLVDLRRRIRLDGRGPRGVALVGTKAYVAQYFSDSLAVVDLASQLANPVTAIALGPAPKLTTERRGEMLFFDATICFQHWQSCGCCHPDARVDALNWDLMNDGLGNPKNTKSMLFSHRTPPAMSESVRETAESAVRAGLTHILFSVRPDEEAEAIDAYLKSLQPLPSPHLVDGKLTPAAERGKQLFSSDRVGCHECHPAPLYTSMKMYDVNSKGPYDHRVEFDTPTLIESWRTAPYLHDGRYATIEALISEGKHGNTKGDVESLSPQEVRDLAEFVRSL